MKNPFRELIIAVSLLLVLLLVLLTFTRSTLTAKPVVEITLDHPSKAVERLTYIEIESTAPLQNLEIKCGDLNFSHSGTSVDAEEKLPFHDSELRLRFKARCEIFPSSIRIRVEPEGLAHREHVLWIESLSEQEVTFLWN